MSAKYSFKILIFKHSLNHFTNMYVFNFYYLPSPVLGTKSHKRQSKQNPIVPPFDVCTVAYLNNHVYLKTCVG